METGVSLIETMRVREGRIPFLDRHLARLQASLEVLGLPRPNRDIVKLARPFAEMGEAMLRVEVDGGRVTVTVRDLPLLDPPAVITAAEPHVAYPHKTSGRDCFTEAAGEAEVAEADDALLVTREGLVAEGTVWNVFWWERDGVRTPALSVGVLPGIGRARLLELMPGAEATARRAELDGKSLFLVNAVRGPIAIASLDGVTVPADPRTLELARRFWPAV